MNSRCHSPHSHFLFIFKLFVSAIILLLLAERALAQVSPKVQEALEESLIEEIKSKDKKAAPKEESKAKTAPETQTRSTPKSQVQSRFEQFVIQLHSAEVVADKLYLRFTVIAKEKDQVLGIRYARIISSEGDQFESKSGAWNDLKLISETPLKHQITFTGQAVKVSSISVLELKIFGDEWGVVQFKKIPVPFGIEPQTSVRD